MYVLQYVYVFKEMLVQTALIVTQFWTILKLTSKSAVLSLIILAVYNQERFILKTIYITKQEKLGLKSAVLNQRQVIMVHVRYLVFFIFS